ncbi:leucine dehydrogenase [candidate division KSB1 bacterium]|nr:MAG: leucine dehydrogenase [candidate division KSB1 bacterium]
MVVFDEIDMRGHEQVVFCRDYTSGLKAIIAIHNTVLGPALGGTRMWNFKSEEDALKDVLRLSRGMTYKAAAAGLNLGGGKAVIIGDPKKDKSELLFRAFGRFVESLGGRYITAEDVGTSVEDMEYVRMETDYVTGIPVEFGGSGDPSPVTALGTFHGMKACVEEVFGTDSLKDITVAVQGVGHVGYYLCELLHKEGAKITVTDIDADKVKKVVDEFGAKSVKPDEIYDVDAEIFSPSALGGIINKDTIPKFKFKIIAGAANNQLAIEKVDGPALVEKNILYAPDYVINAGGLINVYNELEGYNREKALNQAKSIYNILKKIFQISKEENIPTYEASNRLAERRIESLRKIKSNYIL